MCPKDVHEIANSVDPDQTAPLGAVWSGSALFAQTYLSKNLGTIQYYTSGWGPYCCGESSTSLSLAILYHGSDFKSQLVAHTGKPIFAYEWLVFFLCWALAFPVCSGDTRETILKGQSNAPVHCSLTMPPPQSWGRAVTEGGKGAEQWLFYSPHHSAGKVPRLWFP